MEAIQPVRDRQPVVLRGAQFFEEDGELMFMFRADASTQIGPRPAVDEDKKKHPVAYDAYLRARQAVDMAASASLDEEPVKRGPGRPRKMDATFAE